MNIRISSASMERPRIVKSLETRASSWDVSIAPEQRGCGQHGPTQSKKEARGQGREKVNQRHTAVLKERMRTGTKLTVIPYLSGADSRTPQVGHAKLTWQNAGFAMDRHKQTICLTLQPPSSRTDGHQLTSHDSGPLRGILDMPPPCTSPGKKTSLPKVVK